MNHAVHNAKCVQDLKNTLEGTLSLPKQCLACTASHMHSDNYHLLNLLFSMPLVLYLHRSAEAYYSITPL